MFENKLMKNYFALTALLIAACCFSAHADIINYPDDLAVSPDTVDFLDMTEDASINTNGAGLFGQPTRSGNSLSFNPSNFDAGGTNGPSSDLVDSHFETEICVADHALPNGILNIDLSEFGDYTIAGNGEVTASINWFLSIPGASGVAAGTSTFAATSAGTGTWQLGVDIDLANGTYDSGQPLVDASGNAITLPGGHIECALFEFDNTLVARAFDNTSSAFIKKKGVEGVDINVTIPEPGTLALTLFGLLGVAGISRRKRA